jgi:hypothetical protein
LLQQPKQIACYDVWSFSTAMQPHTAHSGHKLLHLSCWDLLDHAPYYLGCWSNTGEVTPSTITRRWKWLSVNGWKRKFPLSTANKFLNSWQDGKNASKCSRIMLKMILQWKKWAALNVVRPCLLNILHVCVKNTLVLNITRLVNTCDPHITIASSR